MEVRELSEPPSLGRLYARGAIGMARTGRGGDGLPDAALVLRDATTDLDRLAAYARVCGFRLRDALPATYPHLLAFPLAVELMVDPRFPFPLAGLVHVRNVITQHRPIGVEEHLTIRVGTRDARPHPKGRQFDVTAEARVDGGIVWSGRSTYLSRGATDGATNGATNGAAGSAAAAAATGGAEPRPEPPAPEEGAPEARWRVPADTGRRYGAVSGDRNPIHLYPLTARAFGFPRPIAHGMWTKARCLAAFEGRLPEAFEIDTAFRRPVLLPTEVAFRSRRDEGGWAFSLRDAEDAAPHLAGRLVER